MERRHSIKLILASAIAPVFIPTGLMKIKPLGKKGDYTGFNYYVMQFFHDNGKVWGQRIYAASKPVTLPGFKVVDGAYWANITNAEYYMRINGIWRRLT